MTREEPFPKVRLIVTIFSGFGFVMFLSYSDLVQPQNTLFGYNGTNKNDSKSNSQPPQDPAFNLNLNPNKRIIILLTAFRSGSTFLGNLFDSNPTMQYMFEPFHDRHIINLRNKKDIIGARADHTESDLRMLYLQQILHNCTAFVTPIVAEKYGWCGSPSENLKRFNTTECTGTAWAPRNSQQEICRYRHTTVIKVIRLSDLSDLLKISKIHSANIQIIQLLRHPVACIMSRRTGGKFFSWNLRTGIENDNDNVSERRVKVAWEVFNYCRDHLKAIEFIQAHPWFKDRYLRITHLEMSLKPLETAEKIYSFINETLTDEIKEYVINITGAQSEGYLNREKVALNVYRNSTDLASKWMKLKSATVKFLDVYSIEAQCKLLFEPMNDVFSVDTISKRRQSQINDLVDNNYEYDNIYSDQFVESTDQ